MTNYLRGRRGFTVVEVLLALGVMAFAGSVAAELAVTALAERRRTDDRLDALDAAANVLEAARAEPWDGLSPAWVARRKLPPDLADRLDGGALTVTVEPEAGRPRVKRVTATVAWRVASGHPARPVTLVGLFAARTAGGTP